MRLGGLSANISSLLAERHSQFTAITGVSLSDSALSSLREVSTDALDILLEKWRANLEAPPTWKSLIAVLKQMDMERLSQQIEEHLNSKCLASY